MIRILLISIFAFTAIISCKENNNDDKPEPKPLCDSVTYNTLMKPVFTDNCNNAGCHSQGAGGIDLRTYAKTVQACQTGKVAKVIKHTSDVIAYHKTDPVLTEREIKIFECWESKNYPE
ncbi:MAG: hypothetical protein HUU47_05610 [Bacteroidetes bacterium]|nr:hypothetical protein [Bacteroidota bacterium]